MKMTMLYKVNSRMSIQEKRIESFGKAQDDDSFMTYSRYYCLFLLCVLGIWQSKAQEQAPTPPSVQVVAQVNADQITLRWAPMNANIWKKANTYGYKVTRFTIKRNGLPVDPPQPKILTPTPIKPQPFAAWEQDINTNDYMAIIAQALYGESFVLENAQEGNGLSQIINTVKEQEQRFSFALFAADMNINAALKAGLGFIDTDIKKEETYLYVVAPAIPEDKLATKAASTLVNPKEMTTLPQPLDLMAIGAEKQVLLSWEYEQFKRVFTAYHIERSEDGTVFKRLSDTPLLNLNDRPNRPAKRMYYVDTLAQNDKYYHYRVLGISPFGTESPVSEVVKSKGVKTLEAVARFTDYNFETSGAITLGWEFPVAVEPQIENFMLEWSTIEKGPYQIITATIPKAQRTITHDTPDASNYYKITAKGANGQTTTSYSKFVQTIDSIPPTAPVNVQGVIDTLGVVRLSWQPNPEKDMLGYRVFRANRKQEEVSQLTVDPLIGTQFIDTVQIKSLNKEVYYQIVAVDKRYNMSDYSEKLTLLKPDKVPPSSPVFTTYDQNDEGITLQWINSSSSDVAAHTLYRQQTKMAAQGWQPIFSTDTLTTYTDTQVKQGIQYRYAIFAKDQSGLVSLPATPITITAQTTSATQYIKQFKGFADREQKHIALSWKITAPEVNEIIIYRNEPEKPPVLWKQLPGTVKKIMDTALSPGTVYTYSIKALSTNGGYSTVETIEVVY